MTNSVTSTSSPASPVDAPPVSPAVSLAIIAIVSAVLLWLVPRPAAVSAQGWWMLVIFVDTILALTLRPVPGGAAVLIAVVITMLTGVLTAGEALKGYSNPAVWLVVAAFLFSRAVIKSGLARRLALLFVRRIGHTSLGLGYSLVACDVLLASVIPGNSARIGGILMPIGRSLATLYQSTPGSTAGLLGTYLMVVLYQGDMIACAMFLTGQVGNPIAAGLAQREFGIAMTWSRWLLVAVVPGLVSFAVIPWLVYRLQTPGIRHTPEAASMARAELDALGPLTTAEIRVIAIFALVCGLWMTSALHPLAAVTVALLGVVCLVVVGSLAWDDVVREHTAWDVFLWFGGIVRLGEALSEFGLTAAFANAASSVLAGWTWPVLMVAVGVLYFYAHYFFASITTHVVSMFVPFASLLIAAGAPPQLVIFALAFFANLSACLTHFGTTPGPILYSSGFATVGQWWRVGFVASLAHLVVWGSVGLAWWKVLGLW